MTYAHTGEGTQNAFAATSSNLVSLRSSRRADMTYTAAQREEANPE